MLRGSPATGVSDLESRQVGRSGVTFTRLVLGSVTFGREIDEEQAYRVMDHAVERGITTFDTAEQYGGGQARERRKQVLGFEDSREVSTEMHSAEAIIGRWLRSRGCRGEITLGTKVSTGGGAENVAAELGSSLERLNTDYVDVYYMHVPNREGTPISETLEALTKEVEAGRVCAIGCSNYGAGQLREALDASTSGGYRRFEIVQPPYSLVSRDIEETMLPLCREEEISVATYSPLGAGLLAGTATPDRSRAPRGSRFYVAPDYMDLYYTEANFRMVELLRARAAELGVPMTRLAMAWVLSNQDVTAMLVGADDTRQLDEAVAAYEMRLDPAVRSEMSAWRT